MISTTPKFLIEGRVIRAEVFLGRMTAVCADVRNEYPDCEIVYQYSHSLCRMRAVDPVVPIGTDCYSMIMLRLLGLKRRQIIEQKASSGCDRRSFASWLLVL